MIFPGQPGKLWALQAFIRKHSYLNHRYPGGLAFISWLLTPGSMPRTPLKSVSAFLFYKQFMQIVGAQTSVHLMTLTYVSWSEGQHDLYFTIKCCLIDWWTSYFGIMHQYDITFNFKLNVGFSDLYFTVQCFCLISWRVLDRWISNFVIMSKWDVLFLSLK